MEEKVEDHHRKKAETKRFLEALRKTYPNGDLRIIVDNVEATYSPGIYRGKRVHAYAVPNDHRRYKLNPARLDMDATKALRNSETQPATGDSEANQCAADTA